MYIPLLGLAIFLISIYAMAGFIKDSDSYINTLFVFSMTWVLCFIGFIGLYIAVDSPIYTSKLSTVSLVIATIVSISQNTSGGDIDE